MAVLLRAINSQNVGALRDCSDWHRFLNHLFSASFMRLFTLFAILLLVIPFVSAKEGSIKLLALSELSNGSQSGTVTDLSLEVKQGNERVFLDTFPLTKITTQISTRFAQQIACKELDVDCSQYDFFYTIHALMGLIGGPSAGAAAAVLTGSLIVNEPINQSITITGTINSGGLIGPVGGIKQKIDAAGRNGIKTVLIPAGTRMWRENNKTIDLFAYGRNQSLEIIEVATFIEAFDRFTGKNHSKDFGDLVIEDNYEQVMKNVAEDICKTVSASESQIKSKVINESRAGLFLNISKYAKSAFSRGDYYTAASHCFRSNLLARQIALVSQKPTRLKILKEIKNESVELQNLVSNLSGRKLSTMGDLQTYMAVDERLVEAKDALDNAYKNLDSPVDSANLAAYASERLGSAVAWSRFFDFGDKKVDINPERLQQSCMNKISEAEERYSYVKSIIPASLVDTRKEIDRAYIDLGNSSFVMCLYRASKAKASSDVILSVLGVEDSQIDALLELKLSVVKKELIKSQLRGSFPIIGYSYYEYANSLKTFDKSSALLFAEYALELSNIDMYFQRNAGTPLPFFITNENLFMFVFGLILGGVVIHYLNEQTLLRLLKK